MRMDTTIYFLFLSVVAGIMIPFQSAMNAQLGRVLHSAYYSTLVVFLVAVCSIGVFIVCSRQAFPSIQSLSNAPVWAYGGGIIGAAYILLIIVCAPKLGIGNVTVLVLLGQMIAALCIDHFGWLQSPVHAINWQRLLGVLMVAGGVYLVKKF